jgi:hypothetical protein
MSSEFGGRASTQTLSSLSFIFLQPQDGTTRNPGPSLTKKIQINILVLDDSEIGLKF